MYRHQKTPLKRPLLLTGGALLVLIAITAGLELANITHFFHHAPTPPTASSETKGELPGSSPNPPPSSSPTTSGTSTQPGDSKSNEGGNSIADLLAPIGDFVSNHHPNLSGNPAPNTLSSACTTTPGASCQIFFTNGNTTVFLPKQTTDRGGSTYWNDWSLQSLHFTTGSWQIRAVATLGNQTKTTVDAMALEVEQ